MKKNRRAIIKSWPLYTNTDYVLDMNVSQAQYIT